jgi:hypothetical protein
MEQKIDGVVSNLKGPREIIEISEASCFKGLVTVREHE